MSPFAALTTVEIKKKWRHWDEATIDSYRLQFRVIDINEDGLIDFHELYCTRKHITVKLHVVILNLIHYASGVMHWMK